MFSKAASLGLSSFGSVSSLLIDKGNSLRNAISPYLHFKKTDAVDNQSLANSLFKKCSAMVAVLFIAATLTPSGTSAEDYSQEMYSDFDASSYDGAILADDEGYLTKFNPQTVQGDRSNLSDKFTHTVQQGETLSTIAMDYGLKTQTILWENNLANANSLRVGQKLVIPPVDGVTHKVAKGETVEKIAQKYSVDAEAIKKQNNLIAAVNVGDEIYVPGAKPLIVETDNATRVSPSRTSSSTRTVRVGTPVDLADSSDGPVGAKPFIMPTRGKLTQGFHKGHYAFDIADASMPPIWAAGAGTVIKASSGTWGGGYGNHIIIDHGNGLKTLYAHLDYLSVNVGDKVTQGQVLGRMGRTGRVYGRTGIHLHFEVIKNGVKQVPSNYY